MNLNHVGVTNKSDEHAIQFYTEVLGLKKTREMYLASELSEQLFSVPREIKVLVFENPGIKVEVFIADSKPAQPDIAHFSIMPDNFSEFLDKAQRSNVEIIVGKHKEKIVYFARDFSGNLIEVKQN